MAGPDGRRSAGPEAPRRAPVFAYGTLMFPEVIGAVTGVAITGYPAELAGYARYRVRGAVYPGIRVADGRCVSGVFYPEVSARSLRLLDQFEGELYRREAVRVLVDGRGDRHAQAWIVRPRHLRLLSDRAWDPQHFRRRHLRRYLTRIGRFPQRVATRRSVWTPG